MNLLRMALSYLNPYQPSYLILFVTARCNANCSFCFYGKEVQASHGKADELTLDEYREISRRAGNIPYLLVSGGEPVLRDDLFDIISLFIKNCHCSFVTVPSNGLSPERTETLFKRLADTYPGCHFRASISVDYCGEKHDEMRGVPGCLERLQETARRVSELKRTRSNITLDAVSVYLNDSSQDHENLRKWVREMIDPDNHELHILRPEWPQPVVKGLDPHSFIKEVSIYRQSSTGKESRYLSSFFRGLNVLYIKGMETVMKGEVLAKCTAGRKFTVITETGKVRLCECRGKVLGDLRKTGYDLKKVLKGSRSYLKEVNRTGCTCTWECAVSCNIVCNPKFFPALGLETVRMLFKSRKQPK